MRERIMRRGRLIGMATAGALLAGGLVTAMATAGDAGRVVAKATLVNDAGAEVGSVRFTTRSDGSLKGRVKVQLPTDSTEFHGLHLHANAAATGCEPGTGFTGVGGHWDVGGHQHGTHTGDLPSAQRQSDGEAEVVIVVDKFNAADIVGKAIIVHAGPDNFGNVPLGVATNQYTDNGTAFLGTGGTASTGNAGARFACGVIEARL